MTCELSDTGLAVGAVVALGALFVLLGVVGVVVFAFRSRRSRAGGALVLLIAAAAVLGVSSGTSSPAYAASADCPGDGDFAGSSLTIVQTSENSDLAPGQRPSPLAGTITNHGTASTYVTEVSVSIDSIDTAPDAAGGTCDARDFVVVDSAMPVGRMLGPGDSADFGGASIALSEQGTNQDSCKGATLHLRYVSS